MRVGISNLCHVNRSRQEEQRAFSITGVLGITLLLLLLLLEVTGVTAENDISERHEKINLKYMKPC